MLLLPLTLPAQNKQKVKFDVGFKGGVQAGIYKQTELTLDGYKYNNKSQNTRITTANMISIPQGLPSVASKKLNIELYLSKN